MTRCELFAHGIYGFLTIGLGGAWLTQTVRRGVSPIFTAYRGRTDASRTGRGSHFRAQFVRGRLSLVAACGVVVVTGAQPDSYAAIDLGLRASHGAPAIA